MNKIAEALLIEKVALNSRFLGKTLRIAKRKLDQVKQPGESIGKKIRDIIKKRPRPFKVTGKTLLPRHPGAGI